MELELKYEIGGNEIKRIEERLSSLGFNLERTKEHKDTYLIVNRQKPDGSREYLRLREDRLTGKVSLDYHLVISALATEEIEVGVENAGKMLKILEGISYDVVCIVKKKRRRHVKGNISVVMDEVKGLGYFVELETLGKETEELREQLGRLASDLRLREEDKIKKRGYPDLLMDRLNFLGEKKH